MRLAQRAYSEFSYDALDQVAREQFISGLSDIEMKRSWISGVLTA